MFNGGLSNSKSHSFLLHHTFLVPGAIETGGYSGWVRGEDIESQRVFQRLSQTTVLEELELSMS